MVLSVNNPFKYGEVVSGDSFAGRRQEIQEITRDIINGHDLVVLAPRRYGKTSLLDSVLDSDILSESIIIQADFMRAPNKEKLAEQLALSLRDNQDKFLGGMQKVLSKLGCLRVTPQFSFNEEGKFSVSFSFFSKSNSEVYTCFEELLELPVQLAQEKQKNVIFVFDEFQEILEIDPTLIKIMRSVFQNQSNVAHVYLGSKQHVIAEIFTNKNAPFWKSAKIMEIGRIDKTDFALFIKHQFTQTGISVNKKIVEIILSITQSHPYATQELCYFLWDETLLSGECREEMIGIALRKLLIANNIYFTRVWDKLSVQQRQVLQALSEEPGSPLRNEYRARHGLPGKPSVQVALRKLENEELVERTGQGKWRVSEPFLMEWLLIDR